MPEIEEIKHTPGPWEACGKAVHAETGREIVFGSHNTRSGSDEEQRANARLIAAAPELLEACREVAEWLDLLKQNYPDMAGLIRGCRKARAAIAKAEGGKA